MEEQQINDWTIYQVIHGSMAYGTNRPGSDRDEKGVCIPDDPRYYYGSLKFEQKDKGWADGVDRCVMDLRKFVSLAVRCNPNIIETLYVDDSDVLYIDDYGKELRDNRDIFLSRLAAVSFVGYAISQLKRIRGHYDWLQNPPQEPIKQTFWNNRPITPTSDPIKIELESHIFEVHPNKDFLPKDLLAYVKHFDGKAYSAAKKKYGNYQRWLRDRNPDRAAIEAEHGYDCKHANHLIRLLRMGKEIVGEGKVLVKRPDAAELLAIREGKFAYSELVEYAEQLKSEVDSLVAASPLPPEPDFKAAEQLMMRLVERRLDNHRG